MADAPEGDRQGLLHHMPVVGSDGRPVGMVDAVEGDYLKLTRSDPEAGGGGHRWLPRSTIAGLDGGMVRLSLPAAQAAEAILDEQAVAQRIALDPDAAAAFGRPVDDAPHGSRAHKHGPKGQREHGQSGQQPGPPGRTSTAAIPDGGRR